MAATISKTALPKWSSASQPDAWIAHHLHEVIDEYRGYNRVNGLVHKVDDDLLSAIRVLCM
jgi:hypothetical protein